jgi:hypothetical protein
MIDPSSRDASNPGRRVNKVRAKAVPTDGQVESHTVKHWNKLR